MKDNQAAAMKEAAPKTAQEVAPFEVDPQRVQKAVKSFKNAHANLKTALKDRRSINNLRTETPIDEMNPDQIKIEQKLITAGQTVKEKRKLLLNETIELAESLGYKSDNPGLEPTQKELAEMGDFIEKSDSAKTINAKEFISSLGKKDTKTADISLADPAKLAPETIDRINELIIDRDTQDLLTEEKKYKPNKELDLDKETEGKEARITALEIKLKQNTYNAAQLMQGKEPKIFKGGQPPTDAELKEANKVMREFQKAVDKVAPPIKTMGKKHKQYDNLRSTAKAIGKTLRADSLSSRAAKIAKSMARSMRNALSSKGLTTAASVVRAPKKETDKGKGR